MLIGSFFFFFSLFSLLLCRGRDEAGAEGAREPRMGIAGAGSGGGRLGAGRPPGTSAEGHSKGRQIRPFPRQMGQRAFQPPLRVGGELLSLHLLLNGILSIRESWIDAIDEYRLS